MVRSYSFEYAGAIITLVDTPGLNDIERNDADVLQDIADWASATYRNEQLLSGIIYLHPITHTCVEGPAMRNLRMFQNLCGQEVLENVLLTTTQWSKVDPAEGQAREDNLRDEGLWGGLIGKGATLQKFHGTRESGFELIHKLMLNTRKPLHIQHQIVRQHMTLLETDAGKCIHEDLIAQREKFRERLEFLEKRRLEKWNRDMRDLRALVEEQANAQRNLEVADAVMTVLTELHAAAVRKREARKRA